MVQFASRTHPGRVHDDNEDVIGTDPERRIWFVADGMGGHASGEVASAVVRDTILQAADLSLPEAVHAAHRAVVEAAAKDARCEGMGSTVAAVALQGNEAEAVWVGDSRIYLWRAGSLRRVSRDHSLMELLRDSKGLTEAEIRVHPQRNVVTQTLGHNEPIASVARVELRVGDRLLLCSDGLHDELEDAQIETLCTDGESPGAVAEQLVDAALASGGRDNVSVVVIAIEPSDLSGPTGSRGTGNLSSWLPAALGVFAALVLGILVLLLLRR